LGRGLRADPNAVNRSASQKGCCWSGSEKAQAFCSGRFVERARAFRLRRVVPVAPYAARPFQVPSDGRFGPAAVLLCDVVEQFEMFVCGLLEKVSRRLATREALQPHAVPERLDQLGKVLIAKRGDQLNVEFEIGIKEAIRLPVSAVCRVASAS
jgi:hypothetical protein